MFTWACQDSNLIIYGAQPNKQTYRRHSLMHKQPIYESAWLKRIANNCQCSKKLQMHGSIFKEVWILKRVLKSHEGRIDGKKLVCWTWPRITPQAQIVCYGRRIFVCHIWPKHFRFLWCMPSLGVHSPWSWLKITILLRTEAWVWKLLQNSVVQDLLDHVNK